MPSSTLQFNIVHGRDIVARLKNLAADFGAIASDYVAQLENRPEIAEEMFDLGISQEFLRRLEYVGRKVADQRLLLASGHHVAGLIRCPLSEQTQALNNGLTVLEPSGTDTRLIPVDQLSREQVKQVFARDHIRTLAEQRTWLEAQQRKNAPVQIEADFRVCRDHVVIFRPVKLTRQLLLQMLQEMN